MKGKELIEPAMRLIDVLASGESLTAAEQTDTLAILNLMMDSYTAERLAVYQIARAVYSLVSGTQNYTYGPSGTFNAARPPKIERVGIIDNSDATQPIEFSDTEYIVDPALWADVPLKSTESSFPTKVYDNNGNPQRTLSFWPIPNISTVQVAIYPWTALSQFADYNTTDYYFPPGYGEFLKFNLALRLAMDFPSGGGASQLVIDQARRATARVKAMNVIVPLLRCEYLGNNARGGAYDWRIDR